MAEIIKVRYSNGVENGFSQIEFAGEVAQQLCNDDSIKNADDANKKFAELIGYGGKLFSDTKWPNNRTKGGNRNVNIDISLKNGKIIYLKRDVWGKGRGEFETLVKYFQNNPQNPFFSDISGLDGSPSIPLPSPQPSNRNDQTNKSSTLQKILYGAPGTGKSHKIKTEIEDKSKILYRTTFHPDTDYATFVGCYKPCMDENNNTKVSQVAKDLHVLT